MKIEEEIKQVKFKNDYQKLTVNLIYTQGWLLDKFSKLLGKYNLTPQQYNVLRILRGQYPNATSVGVIKERMLQKISDSSRLVDRLERKGFLSRKMNKDDRRKTDIKITKKGLILLKKVEPEADKFDNILHNLSVKEIKTLNKLLDKMRG